MEIKIEQVERVYSGKPGCACGCNGNYSEKRNVISGTLKKYALAVAQGRKIEQFESSRDGGVILYWDRDDEEDTRTYTIYLKPGVVVPMAMGGDPFAAAVAA